MINRFIYTCAAFLIICLPWSVAAHGFMLGQETTGAKLRLDEAADFNIRLRLQLRGDYGDLAAARDLKSYETESDFFIGRAGIELFGNLADDLKYNLIIESVKSSNIGKKDTAGHPEIKVAYIDYGLPGSARIRFGKGKLPYSRISMTSFAAQLFIERPQASIAGRKYFDDYYQPNLMVYGKFLEDSLSCYLSLADGWENGAYLNGKDDKEGQVFQSAPLYIARVEVSPPGFAEKNKSDAHLGEGRHITLGLDWALQRNIEYSNFNGSASNDSEKRMRAGADISYHFEGLTFQAEYAVMDTDYSSAPRQDRLSKGWYAQAGYFIPGIDIEPAVRYEEYDQDDNSDKKSERDMTIGVNWYLKGHSLKISTNWAHSVYEDSAESGLKVKGRDAKDRDVYQVQVQMYL